MPLNSTAITGYVPGFAYVCVGEVPEPVVPSPNSQRTLATGLRLTTVSELKLTD